jgi:hypothetical protein
MRGVRQEIPDPAPQWSDRAESLLGQSHGAFMAPDDDEDLPFSYLFYVIAVMVVMAVLVISGVFLWFH